MTTRIKRLELTWIGKETRPRLEPRILMNESALGHAPSRHRGRRSDHWLIEGDNLLALKAIEQEFAGKIKCIYIDPPYNTGSAFFNFDDGLEHSLWLSLMRDRLEMLWKLLTPQNGTLLISINDDECHYLKVLCDEVFGRSSFYCSFVWNYEGNTDNQAKIIRYHEYVLAYSKSGDIDDPKVIDPNVGDDSKLFRDEIRNTVVKNGPKNPPVSVLVPAGFPASFQSGIIHRNEVQWPQYSEDIIVENGKVSRPVSATTGWSSRNLLEAYIASGFRPVLDTKGQQASFEITRTGAIEVAKRRASGKGHVVSVLRGFGTTNQMRLMLQKLGLAFSYPKPVDLIAYLVEVFSGPEDIILDSFAGSGTTGHAVLKLNAEKGSQRRCILVELDANTARNVIVPRLRAVIDGHPGAGLPGFGGGFRFFRLAPSLLEKDKWGNWVISKEYNPAMLAEAMCKLKGFRYAPHQEIFWIHGQSTETDYIYVTTQNLGPEQLKFISEQVGSERSLLICCRAFRGGSEFKNLTIKKIPLAVLAKCEWGRDDYSLNVKELAPVLAVEEAKSPTRRAGYRATGRRGSQTGNQDLPLFDDPTEDNTP